jgi:putative membrane protein
MTTLRLLSSMWTVDGFALALATAGVAAWAILLRGRHTTRGSILFGAAVTVFLLALCSPIGLLARGYLFSAHMLQHILLVLVVPMLVLLALSERAAYGEPKHHPARFLTMWLLGVGAMWFWHAPTLCDAASRSLAIQRVQTLSLLGMGGAFWSPVFGPKVGRLSPFGAIVYLFTACAACTFLGVLVTFSPVEVCSIYANPIDTLGVLPLLREGWGLTPKADQEVGGLLMWVPGCLVYAGSILAMYGRYMRGGVSTPEAA